MGGSLLVYGVHRGHKCRMNISQLDQPIECAGLNLGDLRPRADKWLEKQPADQSGKHEQNSDPEENPGDRRYRLIVRGETDDHCQQPADDKQAERRDGTPKSEAYGPAAGSSQRQVSAGPLRRDQNRDGVCDEPESAETHQDQKRIDPDWWSRKFEFSPRLGRTARHRANRWEVVGGKLGGPDLDPVGPANQSPARGVDRGRGRSAARMSLCESRAARPGRTLPGSSCDGRW